MNTLHSEVAPPAAEGRDALLGMALDQIDYGMLLLSLDGTVSYANRAARAALGTGDDRAALRLQMDLPMRNAIAGCARGLRSMVLLAAGKAAILTAVIPLQGNSATEPGHALLVLSRTALCQPLAMDFFARVHGLTPAESAVLRELCDGDAPGDIASRTGVAVSTVRTHIANLRQKTGASAILDLVRMLTKLPPMRSLLN